VIHDQQERQLHFENAQLRVLGIPVFWLPRLRLPDPTLKRATGFLVPKMRSTSKLGFGIKAPYFITMGRYADLLLTPYLSAKTTTLEYRLRKNWARGEINLGGAVSRDDLRPGETRSFLFGTGGFAREARQPDPHQHEPFPLAQGGRKQRYPALAGERCAFLAAHEPRSDRRPARFPP